ncbi:hypothetical protein Val02_62100 [Virgisporangium aliadipatigenens]|uniref:Uncharacterized protein n=1 Tax=Virgisporangium aliadipatigenens TaxID=741659 RepID=A0A8J3YPF0_9ACTN|nr:hypothetical protein [Virgisporangium aliadipatigenens]GIJ49324.1 hypothetical protein Val02_62100 [Virgisporangium aliadipatigenens]
MTQRIRELLDSAVEHVEPQVKDPVPAVVQRARSQRLRAVAAGAVACATLLAGGVAVASMSARDAAPETASPVGGRPPTPRLVDGKIVAGGVVIPVPAGWRVVTPDSPEWRRIEPDTPNCETLENTVVIAGPDDHGCPLARIEIRGRRTPFPMGQGELGTGGKALYLMAPRMLTLAGGEPAWLATGTTDDVHNGERPPGYGYHNTLVIPWAQVSIDLRFDGAAQRRFIDTVRTTPEHDGRLVLPKSVAVATLDPPAPDPRTVPDTHRKTTDPNTIAAVLRLLGSQDAVADNRRACATEEQPTARLTLDTVDAPPPATPGVLPPSDPAGGLTSVIISFDDDCREAVSSDGGRVRLSAEALVELQRLFGIRP